MPKFRFRWADEDVTHEGDDVYKAFDQVRDEYGILPLDTTIQIDLIEEGTS